MIYAAALTETGQQFLPKSGLCVRCVKGRPVREIRLSDCPLHTLLGPVAPQVTMNLERTFGNVGLKAYQVPTKHRHTLPLNLGFRYNHAAGC